MTDTKNQTCLKLGSLYKLVEQKGLCTGDVIVDKVVSRTQRVMYFTVTVTPKSTGKGNTVTCTPMVVHRDQRVTSKLCIPEHLPPDRERHVRSVYLKSLSRFPRTAAQLKAESNQASQAEPAAPNAQNETAVVESSHVQPAPKEPTPPVEPVKPAPPVESAPKEPTPPVEPVKPAPPVESAPKEPTPPVEPVKPAPPVESVTKEPTPPVESVKPAPPVESVTKEPTPPVESAPKEPAPPVESVTKEPTPPVESIQNQPSIEPVESVTKEPTPPVESIQNQPSIEPVESAPKEPTSPVESAPKEPTSPAKPIEIPNHTTQLKPPNITETPRPTPVEQLMETPNHTTDESTAAPTRTIGPETSPVEPETKNDELTIHDSGRHAKGSFGVTGVTSTPWETLDEPKTSPAKTKPNASTNAEGRSFGIEQPEILKTKTASVALINITTRVLMSTIPVLMTYPEAARLWRRHWTRLSK